ncbi:SH3 domain-containing protein [Brevibacillus panacihumi]|uniref:SH3 domain-containing protein n=1 Tax=Brevibacillus panacihumi TaxID=497735 RepID=UPI001182B6F0|nr:SH3 domain-containing protein [Brevibacillus panacihumi]
MKKHNMNNKKSHAINGVQSIMQEMARVSAATEAMLPVLRATERATKMAKLGLSASISPVFGVQSIMQDMARVSAVTEAMLPVIRATERATKMAKLGLSASISPVFGVQSIMQDMARVSAVTEAMLPVIRATERATKMAKLGLSASISPVFGVQSIMQDMARVSAATEAMLPVLRATERATKMAKLGLSVSISPVFGIQSIMQEMARVSAATEMIRPASIENLVKDNELIRLTESLIKPLHFDRSLSMRLHDIPFLVEVNEMTSVKLDRIITLEEMKKIVKESFLEAIYESGVQDSLKSIQELLIKIIQILLKKGNGFLAMVILTLFLNATSTHIIDPLLEHVKNTVSSTSNEKEIANKLHRETSKDMGLDRAFLENYRFVTTHSLPVFERAARQSKRANVLEFGQVVQVIRERKDWVLVEWKMNEDVMEKGWVYARYLKPFK